MYSYFLREYQLGNLAPSQDTRTVLTLYGGIEHNLVVLYMGNFTFHFLLKGLNGSIRIFQTCKLLLHPGVVSGISQGLIIQVPHLARQGVWQIGGPT